MNPVGRPPVLDDIKRHEIYALVTAGYILKQASEYVDCSVVTINREMSPRLLLQAPDPRPH